MHSSWRLTLPAAKWPRPCGVYELLRVLLRDELGTTPAAGLAALHRRLLTRDEDRTARPFTAEPTPASEAT